RQRRAGRQRSGAAGARPDQQVLAHRPRPHARGAVSPAGRRPAAPLGTRRLVSYTTWDIETSIHTSFKRKANPFDQRNWVVTHGWKKKGDAGVTEQRFGHKRPPPGWLGPVLAGTRILIGQNIKFDLLHAL